jgi:hypothetical protein
VTSCKCRESSQVGGLPLMLSTAAAVAFAFIAVPAYILVGSIARIYVIKSKVRLVTDTLPHSNPIYELKHSVLAPQNLYLAARCPDVLLLELSTACTWSMITSHAGSSASPSVLWPSHSRYAGTPWTRQPCVQLDRRGSLLDGTDAFDYPSGLPPHETRSAHGPLRGDRPRPDSPREGKAHGLINVVGRSVRHSGHIPRLLSSHVSSRMLARVTNRSARFIVTFYILQM